MKSGMIQQLIMIMDYYIFIVISNLKRQIYSLLDKC